MALLIDELRKSGTPINTFFKEYFPNLPRLRQSDFLQMKHAPLLVPPTVPGRPQQALVGTAFSYRVRTWLNPAGMVLDLENKGWLDGALPLGMDLNHRAACIFLAYADRAYRSGMDRSTGDPEPHVLDEVDALHELAKRASPFGPPSDSIILAPEFGGGEYNLRADADLIADGTAWEIKAAVTPVASARGQSAMLWPSVKEVIALILLDWNNDYDLKHAGIYWGRHGAATVLSLDEIAVLGRMPISELRERLRDWLTGGWLAEARGYDTEPTGRFWWFIQREVLDRQVAPALARGISGALALEDTPQGYLEALAVAKAVPLVAEPMAEHLVHAVLTIANADLERTEQGLTQSAGSFLGDAYRIRFEALERAADSARRALIAFEEGDAEWVAAAVAAAEAETERMYRYSSLLSDRRPRRSRPFNDADPTPMSS